jgi:DNA topoisomerase VI subunit B
VSDDDTYSEFSDAVNMTAKRLEVWLDTDESKEVGQKKDGSGESTGHEMGRRIVTLLNTKKGDLSEDDYAAMRKVVGYVKRHLAQRPDGDVTDTPWRYSLMNWGHDPDK